MRIMEYSNLDYDNYDKGKFKSVVNMEYYEVSRQYLCNTALEWINNEFNAEMISGNYTIDKLYTVHYMQWYNGGTNIKRNIVFQISTGAVVYLEEETIEEGLYRTIKTYREA